MINAIRELEQVAASYRSMTTPDANCISETSAKRHAELADEFEKAAKALRELMPNVKIDP